MTGDYTPDLMALLSADIIISTPEKWDGISRNWHTRSYVKKVYPSTFFSSPLKSLLPHFCSKMQRKDIYVHNCTLLLCNQNEPFHVIPYFSCAILVPLLSSATSFMLLSFSSSLSSHGTANMSVLKRKCTRKYTRFLDWQCTHSNFLNYNSCFISYWMSLE